MERFWMVYAEKGQSPKVQHTTLVEAKQEAERILRMNMEKGIGGVVFVLQAIEAVSIPTFPLTWEALE